MSSIANNKDIALLAGLSVGSLVIGGLIGYYVSQKTGTDVDYDLVKAGNNRSSALDKYVVNVSDREPQVLAELRKYTVENVDMAVMLTDPIEAQLFRMLLRMLNAKKCMEVGTFTGYNALNMAMCIPPDGVVYALDVSQRYVNHGKNFFEKANVSNKIDIRIAPAAETMDKFIEDGQQGTFDLIFVDADKVNYDAYYEKGLVLLRRGGIIALDNCFQGGRVLNTAAVTKPEHRVSAEAINKLNQKIKLDNRVEVSLLKIADGVSLCLKL